MSAFTVRIPGDPPSWNHAYKDVYITRNGVRTRARAKTAEAVDYQVAVNLLVKSAKPVGWTAGEQVRLIYDMNFKRDRDADNALKLLNDAIARALGVDDKRFLPCVRTKTKGNRSPFVEVTIQ